jgi:hypothetical protein
VTGRGGERREGVFSPNPIGPRVYTSSLSLSLSVSLPLEGQWADAELLYVNEARSVCQFWPMMTVRFAAGMNKAHAAGTRRRYFQKGFFFWSGRAQIARGLTLTSQSAGGGGHLRQFSLGGGELRVFPRRAPGQPARAGAAAWRARARASLSLSRHPGGPPHPAALGRRGSGVGGRNTKQPP